MLEKKRRMLLYRLYGIGRWIMAAVFLYAAGAKLIDLRAFAEVVADYGLVVDGAVTTTAVVIAVVEVIIGIALAADVRGGASAAAALLIVFMAVLSYGLWLGLDIDCGCFGVAAQAFDRFGLAGALARNVVLLAVCALLLVYRRSRVLEAVPASQLKPSMEKRSL